MQFNVANVSIILYLHEVLSCKCHYHYILLVYFICGDNGSGHECGHTLCFSHIADTPIRLVGGSGPHELPHMVTPLCDDMR